MKKIKQRSVLRREDSERKKIPKQQGALVKEHHAIKRKQPGDEEHVEIVKKSVGKLHESKWRLPNGERRWTPSAKDLNASQRKGLTCVKILQEPQWKAQ
jgi:hypothetical protein